MAKHRGSVYTVIREQFYGMTVNEEKIYIFSAVVGTYATLDRAEEIVGISVQFFRDAGVPDGVHRFSTQINTYYDE